MRIRVNSIDRLILTDRPRPYAVVAAGTLMLALLALAWSNPAWLRTLGFLIAMPASLAIGFAFSLAHEAVFDARRQQVTIRRANRVAAGPARRVPFAAIRGVTLKESKDRRGSKESTYRYTLLTDDGPLALSPLPHPRQPQDAMVAELRAWLRSHNLPTGG